MNLGIDVRAECERFLPSARRFIAWAQRAGIDGEKPSLRELHSVLAELQAAASCLPLDIGEQNLTGKDGPSSDHKDAFQLAARICKNLSINEYCVVFDALDAQDREAMITTLEDDIGDIYADLLDGLLRYEAGEYGDALWDWHFTYWNHWGRHLALAQTAVYSRLALWGDD